MNAVTKPLFEALEKRLASEPILARLELMSLVRPSVRLTAQRVPDAEIGIGESRIGGLPDVPPGFEWPRWEPAEQEITWFGQSCGTKPRTDRCGEPWAPESPTPLGFIAQLDLSALPRMDEALPDSGWLYFFYDQYCETWGNDPTDRGSCRVIYANPDRSTLSRAKAPSDIDRRHVARPCRVDAKPELTLPYYLPDLIPNFEYGTSASGSYETTPEYEVYEKLCDELTPGGVGAIHHRLLGYPQLMQDPMELECQMVSNGLAWLGVGGYETEEAKQLESGAADWRLLLQIDTDEEEPGWIWGLSGRIYFWIKQQDLKSLRFDDVWLILQCQ